MAFPIGDYSTSARAVVNNMNAVLKASRDNAFNTTAVSNAAIQARAKQRNAVTNAKALREKTKDSVETSLALNKKAAKTNEQVRDILKPAQRMAGVVGLLGTGAGVYVMNKNFQEEKAAAAARDAKAEERLDKYQEIITQQNNRGPFVPGTRPNIPSPTILPIPEPTPFTPSSSSSGSSSSTELQSISSYPRQSFSQPQMKQLLLDQGMDDANATIGAAVGMGESSGQSWRLNPNTDKEYSLGLWQHNRDTGEDRRSMYGIKDWSELADPVTNARATYRLWKRAGGSWDDWGAYTNGSYLKFLNQ